MKQTVVKAVLLTSAMVAMLPLFAADSFAKESIQVTNADMKQDGYSIVLTDDGIVEGEDILDYQAPGFSINHTVIFYDKNVHDPKVSIVKDRGTDHETLVSPDCYTIEVPKGRQYIGNYTYKITFKGELAKYGTVEKTMVITANNRAANVKTKAYRKKISVSWAPFRPLYSNRHVAGYSVSYEKTDILDNQDWKVFRTHKIVIGRNRTSVMIRNLESKTSYGVMVRPFFNVNGRRIYGNWSEITYVTVR